MARIDEIAPDLFRISVYVPQIDLQFNHFLVRDEEPLLFHTGMRRMFPDVRDAVARVLDPATIRWSPQRLAGDRPAGASGLQPSRCPREPRGFCRSRAPWPCTRR